jgi:hypothetical protein
VILLVIVDQAQAQVIRLESLKFQTALESMQSRICAELLTDRTIAGARSVLGRNPAAAKGLMDGLLAAWAQAFIFLKVTNDMGQA